MNSDFMGWLTTIMASLFISWTVYLLLKRFYFRQKEFRGWLKRPHIQQTLAILKRLYHNVNAVEIARKAWQQRQFRDYAFIYGEIDLISFIAILEAAQLKSDDIFYDLGSGAGKAIFTAALAFNFKVCKGIELVPELYQLSCQLKQQLPKLMTQIEFINADFLTVDFSDADVVFINAACFVGEAWQAIVAKFIQLKAGTRIIVGSKELPIQHFNLMDENLRYMSWGKAMVRIYRRFDTV
ncbi:MAG: histone methylation protein [Gammaproteobacteria bacterium]|jgi:SAM-dependent methyltransferase|nr:histone methylation protein [Gammaproteobacteria bacterium]